MQACVCVCVLFPTKTIKIVCDLLCLDCHIQSWRSFSSLLSWRSFHSNKYTPTTCLSEVAASLCWWCGMNFYIGGTWQLLIFSLVLLLAIILYPYLIIYFYLHLFANVLLHFEINCSIFRFTILQKHDFNFFPSSPSAVGEGNGLTVEMRNRRQLSEEIAVT